MEPLPAYAYLPHVLGDLKALLPRLQAAPLSKQGARLTPRVLAELLRLLELLPDLPDIARAPPPPFNLMPPLTVTATGKAKLSHGLVVKLNLRAGQPATVLPPSVWGDHYWYLYLRADAPGNIDWYPGKKPKIKGLDTTRWPLQPGQQQVLLLVPGEPEFAGVYPLLPASLPTAIGADSLTAL